MIQQPVLSRTRSNGSSRSSTCTQSERRQIIMEDVVERMRKAIFIDIDRSRKEDAGVGWFSVGFESTDARTSMRVTERLAALFVQENIEDRALLADQTDQFLKGQVEEQRRRLHEFDKVLLPARGRGAAPSSLTTSTRSLSHCTAAPRKERSREDRRESRAPHDRRAVQDHRRRTAPGRPVSPERSRTWRSAHSRDWPPGSPSRSRRGPGAAGGPESPPCKRAEYWPAA